jgi:hypothetical protein
LPGEIRYEKPKFVSDEEYNKYTENITRKEMPEEGDDLVYWNFPSKDKRF